MGRGMWLMWLAAAWGAGDALAAASMPTDAVSSLAAVSSEHTAASGRTHATRRVKTVEPLPAKADVPVPPLQKESVAPASPAPQEAQPDGEETAPVEIKGVRG